jgi:quinol monooxygenase YgiN
MIAVIATLTVQPGKEADFEAVFTDLAAKVRANEPGNKLYQLSRSRETPNVYKVLELYTDQDALVAHGKTEYFRAAGAGLGAVLGGAPVIEYLDTVG